MVKIQSTYEVLSETFANAKVIFAPFTGCELARCAPQSCLSLEELRYEKKGVHPEQEILEQTLMKLNKKIVAFNSLHSLPTPLTLKAVLC